MDDAYETFHYDSMAYRATHPDWLGTLGRMFGLTSAPATECRVLELGCGTGGNLVPLADALPTSHVLGIDLAVGQIDAARRDAAALGLGNARFEACDIRDLPADIGRFDYIVCHGVYSWVPDDVRARILAICREHLDEQGIAFLSFNALPGWHLRGMLRDLLRRMVPPGPAPEMAAAARRFLATLREHGQPGPLAPWLTGELDLLASLSDRYLYFEHLVEHNRAFYLTDVLDDAARAGLTYLANADVNSPVTGRLGSAGGEVLAPLAEDRIAAEQLIDLLTVRFFHRILLCRDDASPSRPDDPARLTGAWIASDLAPPDDTEVDLTEGVPATLTGADGRTLTTSDAPIKAVLVELATARPAGLALTEVTARVAVRLGVADDDALRERVRTLAHDLVLQGQLQAGFTPRHAAVTLPTHPVAPRFARWQAAEDRPTVTTTAHENQTVDTLDRVLLEALDGTRDRDALLPVVRAAQASDRLVMTIDDVPVSDESVLAELIDTKLSKLRADGLILAPEAEPAGRVPLTPPDDANVGTLPTVGR